MEARFRSDAAFHPGRLLAEELEVRNLTQREFAHELGRSSGTTGELIRGRRRVSADIAIELEAALGTPAYLWLRLQAAYDLDQARRKRTKAS
jgi:addiction module HigA family antidote